MFKHLVIFFSLFLIFSVNVFSQGSSFRKGKFIYDSHGKRDPFFKVEESVETSVEPVQNVLSPREKLKQKGVVVNSIVWDPTNPAILINDDILEIGDTVQGVIIRAIEQDYVVFEIDGELVEVPLN